MGNCYSQCEETITPSHLGDAAANYQRQHYQNSNQQPPLRIHLQKTLDQDIQQQLERESRQTRGFETDEESMRMRIDQKVSAGLAPTNVERLTFAQSMTAEDDFG